MSLKRHPTTVFISLVVISFLNEQCLGQGYNQKPSPYDPNQGQQRYNQQPTQYDPNQGQQRYNQQQSQYDPNKRQFDPNQSRPNMNYNLQNGVGNTAQQPPQQGPNPADLSLKENDLKRYMNASQDPCQDFYGYACGKWLQNLGDVKVGDTLSVAEQLDRKVNTQLQILLRGSNVGSNVLKNFYTTCTSSPLNDQKIGIKNFVNINGGLPDIGSMQWQENNYPWIAVLTNLKQIFNIEILMVLTKNARQDYILEEPQKTILPADLCSSFTVQQMLLNDEIYNNKQREIKDTLRSWFDLNDDTANRLAGDILKFEYELCQRMRKSDMLNIPNVDENRTDYNQNYRPLEPNVDNMNIFDFVKANGQLAGQGQSPRFSVRNPEYFNYLGYMIKTRKASLAFYIMYRALSELAIPLNLPQGERSFFCACKAMQFFPVPVGNLYLLQSNSKMRELILQDIRTVFEDIKQACSENKMSVMLTVGAPSEQPQIEGPNNSANGNYWQLLLNMQQQQQQQQGQQQQPGQQQWSKQQFSAQTGNAGPNLVESFATTVSSNDAMIQFGWGLLQPPFYSLSYPKAVKYSSIGFLLARELMKSNIRKENDEKMLPGSSSMRTSATNPSSSVLNKECFRAQTSSYFYNTPDIYRNGTQLSDIMADASAINIAFTAYNKWLSKPHPPAELDMETFRYIKLSNTQLFFANYAVSRCAVRYKENTSALAMYPMDRHTPERWNVNGPLSNGFEFGRDFNCPIGTEMNMADKCSMFNEVQLQKRFQ